ncbi:site-specific integrase [Pseudomonas aeruginosa]|uniref:site-specific integrase n=1 Tax=Pseudomonas aeruginosa TaxID=287 RepID=UPI0023581085|nr:site-specific integrase [Pseudomonas aeruginosa]
MQAETLHRYRTRAKNFYREHIGTDTPTSAQICAALVAVAADYLPNSFRTLKNALLHDQKARGHVEASHDIQALINPMTAPDAGHPRRHKPKRIKAVPKADFLKLKDHLKAHGRLDEFAATVLARYLGARPCEMRSITVQENVVHIIGGKKTITGDRGADRDLVIEHPDLLRLIEWASQRLARCERSDAAIRDRLRLECRKLWPRRKLHPSLYSFRHQLGADLKASGESPETLAYLMGHQSVESIAVYGDRRAGTTQRIHVKPASNADLSKIRRPRQPPRFGRERPIEEIRFPLALGNHWMGRMQAVVARRGRPDSQGL